MPTYAFIGCSKSKLDHKAKARDIYTGDMFKKSLELAEKNGEKVYILSAKHHLLSPDKEIEPYNEYLADFSAEEKQEWYDEVLKEMKSAGIDFNAKARFYCGEDYYKGLMDSFPNGEKAWKGEGMGYIMENLDKELGRSINYEQEQRSFDIEMRADMENRIITGYAAVFNSRSEYLGFYETLMPGCITEETIALSDVVCNFNHDANIVLARSKYGEGTLNLSVDDKGLKFSFEAPNTTDGNNLLELVKRGDLSGCSFAFALDPEDREAESWEHEGNEMHRYIRHIARLYDVSVVVHPAYEAAGLTERSKKTIEDIKEAEAKAAEEARVKALNEKHDALLEDINKW